MDPANKSGDPIPGPAVPGHFPLTGIPSLPSPSQQHQAQTAGLWMISRPLEEEFKAQVQTSPTLSTLREIPAPWGDKAALRTLPEWNGEHRKEKEHELCIIWRCCLPVSLYSMCLAWPWAPSGGKGDWLEMDEQ